MHSLTGPVLGPKKAALLVCLKVVNANRNDAPSG